MAFIRQSVRHWTQPDNHGLIWNADLDLTCSIILFLVSNLRIWKEALLTISPHTT